MNNYYLSEAILAHRQIEDYFFSSISQMYQHIGNGVRAYVTGVETHALNFLLVADECGQTAKDLKMGIRLLDEKINVPFSIVVMEPDSMEPDNQILAAIQQEGFVFDPDSITTAMELDLTSWQVKDGNAAGYKIRRADHCLADWAIPIESAFETGGSISEQYLKCHQAALDAGKCLYHYALYVDGQPVCSLTLSRLGNIVRLDEISTVVDKQRRGYASTLINHVLSEAKQHGATACYLDASRDGNGLYQSIGFKPLFEYQGFMRE
ncbi:GNAT family N-acetyltransferase [Xenorhabdus hominickii]|uniref:GNAT family N-acetyltransferase n=1 Tax=Xenorhabdus hominickii TaxID=351679 RepID=A0A2G0QGG4_XENHO|nr:GNAT family N-acetyltransferase [Xenorhabdus hominickii]AOM42248.1 GNAT family acetyltransferase [Xenorhabdus hominickii]PHM58249.1 GNAT family N-acetyltransferase [Xenorhabdus hominickii]